MAGGAASRNRAVCSVLPHRSGRTVTVWSRFLNHFRVSYPTPGQWYEPMFRHLLATAARVPLGAPAPAQTTVDQRERLDTQAHEAEFDDATWAEVKR